MGIHYNPEIYPEPEKFDPERFTEENKRDRHPMAHLPFGEGPRNCVGLRFGLMQTKIGLIELLTNFKFSPSSQTTIPMDFLPSAPLLCPINDMWLKVEKLE
jgi:cytochrome P450 family 6